MAGGVAWSAWHFPPDHRLIHIPLCHDALVLRPDYPAHRLAPCSDRRNLSGDYSAICAVCDASKLTPRLTWPPIATTRPSKPEGETKKIAILFADAKSFTALAERQDPRKVYGLMKQCMQILVDETYRAGGAIDKFTGDGVMGSFGVPQERPDDAERAVRAALNMQQSLQRFNREHIAEYEMPLQIRIGLNIGRLSWATLARPTE